MKITATQRKALQLIADNEGDVIVVQRGIKGYKTINGNAETKLDNAGMIARVFSKTITRYNTEVDLYTWTLTDAGRAALAA